MIPSQEDLDTTRDTVAWLEANMITLEPSAVNTIASFNDVYHNIPDEDELEDHE